MLRTWIFLPLIMMSFSSFSRPQREIPEIVPAAHEHYQIQQFDRQFEDKTYRIYVAIPKQQQQNYPTLFMLDGNGQFPLAVNQAISKNLPINPLIIGIGNPENKAYITELRMRDYTPAVEGEEFAKGGGDIAFRQFITSDLKPWAEKQFPIDVNHETFFGHSFAGLFVLRTALQYPSLFTRYVSASPSLWWGHASYINKSHLRDSDEPLFLTITLGELEEKPDLNRLSKEQQANFNNRWSHITARELCTLLAQQNKSQCQFVLFKDKSHGSSIPDAIETALEKTLQP